MLFTICRTIVSTQFRKYLHLQRKKATGGRAESTATSQGNIIKITDREMDYMRQLFNFSGTTYIS